MRPAHIKQKLRKLQIPRLASRTVELAECELDFLVAGRVFQLRRRGAERSVDEIGRLHRHIEKRSPARRLPIGDGGLVEMPHVVELVAVRKIAPARRAHAIKADLPVFPLLGEAERPRRVEVAVRLLCAGNRRIHAVDVFFELCVRMCGKNICRTLDNLVHIGVVIRNAPERPPLVFGGVPEVRYARELALLEVCLKRNEPVRLKPRQPEPARHRHVGDVGRADGAAVCKQPEWHRRKRGNENLFHGVIVFHFHGVIVFHWLVEKLKPRSYALNSVAIGVTPFFKMMLPYFAVSPEMTTAYAFFARS